MNHNETATFIVVLLNSGTVTHLQHLMTKSFAEHMALGEYYDEIIELVDSFAEAYQGKYGQIEDYPEVSDFNKNPLQYLEMIQEFVQISREHLPQDSELQNIVDEIADLVNTTVYKLKFLK